MTLLLGFWLFTSVLSVSYAGSAEDILEDVLEELGSFTDSEMIYEVHEDVRCPYHWAKIPHPTDCSKYFMCLSDLPVLVQCENEDLYDVRSQQCQAKQSVNCGQRVDKNALHEFACPFSSGKYPDPRNCSRFYVCKSYVPTLYQCPESYLYQEHEERCLEGTAVQCGDRPGGQAQHEFTCPFFYGRYPHPSDCSRFYMCHFSIPFLYQCPKSQLYDERKEQCLESWLVQCGDRQVGLHEGKLTSKSPIDNRITSTSVHQKITQPPTTTEGKLTTERTTRPPTTTKGLQEFVCPFSGGQYPDPTHCSRFYVCKSYKPTLYECPESYMYDEQEEKCLEASVVQCNDRPGEIGQHEFTCPFLYGRYPDPTDCSRFYACHFSIPTLYQCPKSQLYDERKEQCLESLLVQCGDRPGGLHDDTPDEEEHNIEEIRCPYTWGTFPHPTDCSKYIICIYNVPTVFNCEKQQLFNAYYRRCLMKDQVTCDHTMNPDDLEQTTSSMRLTTTTRISTRRTTQRLATEFSTTTTTLLPNTTMARTSTNTTVSTFKETIRTTTSAPTIKSTTSLRTTRKSTYVPTTRSATSVLTTRITPSTLRIGISTGVPKIKTSSTPTTRITIPEPVRTTTSAPTVTTSAPTTRGATSVLTSRITPSTPRVTTPILTTVGVRTTKSNTPPPTDCEEDDLECIVNTTGDLNGWFDCPERFGHFPHGSSRQLFIHCDNWRPFVKKCADDTVFSPKYLVCMWLSKPK